MKRKETYGFLWALLHPFRWLIAGAVLLAAATVLANVGLLSVSAVLISFAALQPPLLDLMVYIVGVRFFGISRALLRYSERYVSHKITFRILTALRVQVYTQIEPTAPAGLQQYSHGQLFDRLLKDIDVLKYFYLRAVMAPAAAILVLLVCSVVLAHFSVAAMVLLLFLFACFGILLPWCMGRLTADKTKVLAEERETWQSLLEDYLGGLADLHNSREEQNYYGRMTEKLAEMARLERNIGVLGNLTTSLLQYGSNLSLVLALLVIIPAVTAGSLNGVYSAMVLLLIWSSFEAIQPFPQALVQLQQSLEVANHLLKLPRQTEDAERKWQTPQSLELAVEHVVFAYENGQPVYTDFSLHCPQGAKLALVGTSGSGKSTLASLLVGFWQPQRGQICLGGIPLEKYPKEQLRELIAVAEQTPFLFTATVRENLLLANSQSTETRLRQALQFACLEDVVTALPDGMDTMLGDNGYRLSGGQRQRLALARIWLRDCPIVILDEIFQGQDAITAEQLRAHLRKWGAGRTLIYITHSLQHLQELDCVYVLQHGDIVEQGTAEVLLQQKDSIFYQMWQLERQQLGGETWQGLS